MLMDLSPTRSLFKSATFSFLLLSLFLLLTGNVLAQKGDASVRGLARGQAAINKLSDRLPAVALRNGKSPNELRQLLLEDPTLYIDDNDKLLYIDDAPEETEKFGEDAPPSPQAGPFPYNETFSLHSRLGSNRVIYLDFDGYVTTGSAWNGGQPINSAPFSIDGDPNSFSQQEQDVIQYAWQRIAEDYAPFDVDVTTQDPGDNAIIRSSASDLQYGTRAVISPTNWYGPGIGGVAYVGAFNSYGTTYKPAFVFSAALGNSEKSIAEATSHEVGHNLGLSHDGTSSSSYYAGHGDWAPIMGVGYYRNVTQWSKGEYPGANQLQDDLAIIQSYGTPVISDDHGNSTTAATVLNSNNINASGLITTRSDVDVFQFSTGSGNVTLNLNPAPRGGNLNIEAKISDAQGNVIATSDPAGLSASFNQTLSAGVYYLTIDGVGTGDYSDYASIGQYSITGTLTASNGQPPVAVAGADVTAGFAPLTVNFSSQGSYDPDGTIVSYAWNFGDGTPSSNQANPSHVYSNAGNYTATLTVTDNDGATNSSSVGINVQQTSTNNVIFVNGISMSLVTEERIYAQAVVTVVDGNGAPLPNVTVTGNWRVVTNNVFTSSVTGTTNASGQVTFNSPRTKKIGTYTLDITNLSASGYTYNPSLNVVTSASIQ